MNRQRTYLDWNATAPLRPDAREATLAALDAVGNPSSVHAEGRASRRIVEDAREAVAALVGADPGEVVFTSGATEANATVLAGGWDTIAVSAMEHESVGAAARSGRAGLVLLPGGPDGLTRLDTLEAALETARAGVAGGPSRTLVSVQLANNETGVVQPVAGIAGLAKANGARIHTDATQAVGRLPVAIGELGVDYLTFSSHKLGGPKGVGALVVRDGAPLSLLIAGGGQEGRRRGGTENVAAIAGFAAAARGVRAELASLGARLAVMRERLEAGIMQLTPHAVIVGAGAPRLPNTTLVALPGRSAETLVMALDLAGVAVSSGAACSSGKVGESHVLRAMGYGADVVRSAVRVSTGSATTEQDMAAFLAAWGSIAGAVARAA